MAGTGGGRLVETAAASWRRLVLPAAPRSARDTVVDALMLSLAMTVPATYLLGYLSGYVGPGVCACQEVVLWFVRFALVVAANAALVAALWWRRRLPVPLFLASLTLTRVEDLQLTAVMISLMLLLTVAVRHGPVLSCGMGVLQAAATTGTSWHAVAGLPSVLVPPAVVVAVGLSVRADREAERGRAERAEQAERERERVAERARRAERTRIAREMHDQLAHRISLVSMHAGALEVNPGAGEEAVASAVRVIVENSAAACRELDEVVSVLGPAQDSPEGPGGDRHPGEGLTDLLEAARAAGSPVRLVDDVPPGPGPPPPVARTVRRVVQESLTNIRKHAPGAAVDVIVRGAPGAGVRLVVVNGPPSAAGPPGGAVPGSRVGLIGLSERIDLVGGTFIAGPEPDGGFRVTAYLPWPADPPHDPGREASPDGGPVAPGP